MASPSGVLLCAFVLFALFTSVRSCSRLPQLFSTSYYRSEVAKMSFSVATVCFGIYSTDSLATRRWRQYWNGRERWFSYEFAYIWRRWAWARLRIAFHRKPRRLPLTRNHCKCNYPYLSFDCRIKLLLNTTYVLPLNQSGHTPLNKCHTIVHLIALTAVQKQFLSSRQPCCNGMCSCVVGEPAKCKIVPCKYTKVPYAEATICINNYCVCCSADWFSKESEPGCHPHVWREKES